ncbi:unnamed protein product, partial [Owenia fusiformis]
EETVKDCPQCSKSHEEMKGINDQLEAAKGDITEKDDIIKQLEEELKLSQQAEKVEEIRVKSARERPQPAASKSADSSSPFVVKQLKTKLDLANDDLSYKDALIKQLEAEVKKVPRGGQKIEQIKKNAQKFKKKPIAKASNLRPGVSTQQAKGKGGCNHEPELKQQKDHIADLEHELQEIKNQLGVETYYSDGEDGPKANADTKRTKDRTKTEGKKSKHGKLKVRPKRGEPNKDLFYPDGKPRKGIYDGTDISDQK